MGNRASPAAWILFAPRGGFGFFFSVLVVQAFLIRAEMLGLMKGRQTFFNFASVYFDFFVYF